MTVERGGGATRQVLIQMTAICGVANLSLTPASLLLPLWAREGSFGDARRVHHYSLCVSSSSPRVPVCSPARLSLMNVLPTPS